MKPKFKYGDLVWCSKEPQEIYSRYGIGIYLRYEKKKRCYKVFFMNCNAEDGFTYVSPKFLVRYEEKEFDKKHKP